LGIEFGSHSVRHSKLHGMSWQKIESELVESKEQIQQELGEPISSFAYPFAFPQEDYRFSERFAQSIRASGYHNCVTTMIGRSPHADQAILLKRLPINDCDDAMLFAAKLAGSYDWMSTLQHLFRRMKAFRATDYRGVPGYES